MSTRRSPVGELLRQLRARRRFSQMALAHGAGISTRHLSFIETGRSRPSTDVLARLAETLQLGLRERNRLLLAAGFAPAYRQTALSDPEMSDLRRALRDLLRAHEPYPAIVVNRYGDVELNNTAAARLLAGLPPHLTEPINTYRAVLHPDGFGDRIRNRSQWTRHLVSQMETRVAVDSDPALAELLDEVTSYPTADSVDSDSDSDSGSAFDTAVQSAVLPIIIDTEAGVLTFASVLTTFGAPNDITAGELALETFLPLDEQTRSLLLEA